MVDVVGPASPGYLLTVLATVSLLGLWVVKPSGAHNPVDGVAECASTHAPSPAKAGPPPGTRRRKKEVFSAVPNHDDEPSSDNLDFDDDI